MSSSMKIRRLAPEDFDPYFDLRLKALEQHPAAFTTDADSWRGAPRETIERHLSNSRDEPATPIFAAFVEEELIGMLGMSREQRQSVSHKSGVWGFYVSPPQRGRGIGRALLSEAIYSARQVHGLRQLRAVVPTSCQEALRLMEKMGFIRYGLEPEARQVNGVFHDQVYLWLPLTGH